MNHESIIKIATSKFCYSDDRRIESLARIYKSVLKVEGETAMVELAEQTGDCFSAEDFEYIDLRGCYLVDANLRAGKFNNMDFSGAEFIRCDLREAYFDDADLSGALLINCNISAATFNGAVVDNITLDACETNSLNFSGTTLEAVQFYHFDAKTRTITYPEIREISSRNEPKEPAKVFERILGCETKHTMPEYIYEEEAVHPGMKNSSEEPKMSIKDTVLLMLLKDRGWDEVAARKIMSALDEGDSLAVISTII